MQEPQSGERVSNPTENPPQRHLYLVLDDWEYGYTIRKVDLTPDGPRPQTVAGVAREKHRLHW